MKSLGALLLFASVLCFSQMSRISVSGNQFVDEEGQKVIFEGYNTSDPAKLAAQDKWDEEYFAEIKKWGANIVRFPVHPSRWRELGEDDYLKLLDRGIELAAGQSMYVIIDWHSIGNLKSELFYRKSYETTTKETFEFWATIAQRYGSNPTVAFYEIYNEPTTNQGKLGVAAWADWKAFNEETITIIRANEGKGVPLVAGFNWAYDLTEAYDNPINAEGIGYVSHAYPQKRPQPWAENWTNDWGKMKEKAPVILTEIGFAGAEEKGAHIPVISDESYGEAITAYCRERDISYVVWVFDAEWSPSLFSNWEYKPTRHGKFFKESMTRVGVEGTRLTLPRR